MSAFVVLSFPLGTADALFAHHIAGWLGDPAFAKGASGRVVEAVLEVVDLFDARDFGFSEGVF